MSIYHLTVKMHSRAFAHKESIYKEVKFSAHAPLTIDYAFNL